MFKDDVIENDIHSFTCSGSRRIDAGHCFRTGSAVQHVVRRQQQQQRKQQPRRRQVGRQQCLVAEHNDGGFVSRTTGQLRRACTRLKVPSVLSVSIGAVRLPLPG